MIALIQYNETYRCIIEYPSPYSNRDNCAQSEEQ